jgi:hypothetical protein
MFFGIYNKGGKHELAQWLVKENSLHVHPACMTDKKVPSVGIPSIDFSDAKQLTEFT